MGLIEHVRYVDPNSYPEVAHEVTSAFLWARDMLWDEGVTRRAGHPVSLECLIGFFPERRTTRSPKSLSFLAISRSRSAYAALRDLEGVFADLYMNTGILPDVTPAPERLMRHADDLPPSLLRRLERRGGLLYVSR